MLYASILDTIGNTPLVELPHLTPNRNVQIYAKLEGQNPSGSVKDRCAKYMIDAAERDGLLSRDKVILEPTSGNTGIALAMIGRVKGYQVMVVIPESVSEERSQLLRAYGAEVVFSEGLKGTNGSIEVAQQMVAEAPQRFDRFAGLPPWAARATGPFARSSRLGHQRSRAISPKSRQSWRVTSATSGPLSIKVTRSRPR